MNSDGSVEVWDVDTGQALFSQTAGPRGSYPEPALSPDGRVVVFAIGREVRVWNTITGERIVLCRISGITPPRYIRMEFGPDGRRVAIADGSSAQVWDISSRRPVGRPTLHSGRITCVSFSLDGRRLVTASEDGTARVWGAATGEPVTPPLTHRAAVRGAVFSPDGQRVATAGGDDTARVWDAFTGHPVTPLLRHESYVTRVAFSAGGRDLVTVGEEVRIWDLAAQGLVDPLMTAAYPVSMASLSADGRRALVVNQDATARLWDVEAVRPLPFLVAQGSRILCAALSPDGRRALIVTPLTSTDDWAARIYDVDTGRGVSLKDPVHGLAQARRLRFTADSRFLLSTLGGWAEAWDAATGRHLGTRGRDVQPPHIAISDDGGRISFEGEVPGLPVADWPRILESLRPLGPSVYRGGSAEISADGRKVMVVDAGAVDLWDSLTGWRIGPPSSRRVYSDRGARISPNGDTILSVRNDGSAQLWYARTGEPTTPPIRDRSTIQDATFSPDGGLILTLGDDESARVWDAGLAEPVTLSVAGDRGSAWRFSDDGSHLIGSANYRALLLRDAVSGPGATSIRGNPSLPRRALYAFARRSAAAGSDIVPELLDPPPATVMLDLPSDKRSLGQLSLLAELLSGERIEDRTGFVAVLRPEDFAGLWREYQEKYGSTADVVPVRLLSWDQAEAEEFEARQQWAAAIPHLDRLVASLPGNPQLLGRRATALASINRRFKALADLDNATRNDASDCTVWGDAALVRLSLGDISGYRRECESACTRFRGTDRVDERMTLLWTCSLAPGAIADLGALWRDDLARSATREERTTLGRVLYRLGRPRAAIKWMNEGIDAEGGATAADDFVLAMAYHALDDLAQARRYLEVGKRWLARHTPPAAEPTKLSWELRAESELLRRQAEALIDRGSGR
jgi:WD40 repeat protein